MLLGLVMIQNSCLQDNLKDIWVNMILKTILIKYTMKRLINKEY